MLSEIIWSHNFQRLQDNTIHIDAFAKETRDYHSVLSLILQLGYGYSETSPAITGCRLVMLGR